MEVSVAIPSILGERKNQQTEEVTVLASTPRTRQRMIDLTQKSVKSLVDLDVRVLGTDWAHGNYLAGTKKSSTHLLYYAVRGNHIYFDIGKGEQNLPPNHVLIVPAGFPQWTHLSKGKSVGIWVNLWNTPRWHFLEQKMPSIHIANDLSKLASAIDACIDEQKSPERYGVEQNISNYAKIISNYIIRTVKPEYKSSDISHLLKIDQLWHEVSADLTQPWTADILAARAHMSVGHLYNIQKRLTGTTPMQMVLRLRMERAQLLLTNTNLTLDRISEEIGFSSAFSFSNAFVRQFGLRPGAYRSQLHKKIK
ncbi:helix-turn-helix transcriptional regulator [Tichowtungia aerotolerans]|uniref:Helix-turn-helix domain-containing protein n=1 Tax=Tichowtungia aerotolerans TaxID=2697043 RepID=A0A6P1MHY6_9BACT|nr:AraC family transcriptional regulator [Tichowtungia aerotolerans]QHI70665.1 helix-turn-helix domain-containing protein [Tichowtungia aerotolerans]